MQRAMISKAMIDEKIISNKNFSLKPVYFAVNNFIPGIILLSGLGKLIRPCGYSPGLNQSDRRIKMPGWVVFLLFFAAYFILMRWILPRLGIQT